MLQNEKFVGKRNPRFKRRYSDEYEEDDSLDGFIEHGEEDPLEDPEYRNIIKGFSRNRRRDYYDDYDDNSSDMEAGFEEIEYEERRSRRIGKKEDE